MSFRFVHRPLQSGLYEPEGIYLSPPFTGAGSIVQHWGEHPDFYGRYHYNGVQLRGHTGLDFGVTPRTPVVAVDQGRVVEISYERHGYERYIKLEHRWGESLYAYIGAVTVDAGQLVAREDPLATAGQAYADTEVALLHFAVRVTPFNRFDGYGGFTDPLPYLNLADRLTGEEAPVSFTPHPMADESEQIRRP